MLSLLERESKKQSLWWNNTKKNKKSNALVAKTKTMKLRRKLS